MAARTSAVLFDFDGTLATYSPPHLTLYVQAAAEHGVEVTEAALAGTVADAWRRWDRGHGPEHRRESRNERAYARLRAKVHRMRLEAAGAAGDLDAVALRIVELESDPAHFALYEDTVPALERLRNAGVRMSVVSNHVWRLGQVIASLGIAPFINAVISSAQAGYRKPHPRIFAAAIEAVGSKPHELLFVGNNIADDVEAPRAAGMRAVLLDRAGTSGDPEAIRTLLAIPL